MKTKIAPRVQLCIVCEQYHRQDLGNIMRRSQFGNEWICRDCIEAHDA